LRCSQKFSVANHAIGVVIACPTCAENLIVPPKGDPEFPEEIPVTILSPTPVEAAPNLARQLMSRLVQGLLFQRNHMLEAQHVAAEQIAVMEQRIAVIQTKLQRRLAYYEERIETLEAENYLLQHRNQQLLKQVKPLPLGTSPREARTRLTDEVLLGA
jgi:hypothetical protein